MTIITSLSLRHRWIYRAAAVQNTLLDLQDLVREAERAATGPAKHDMAEMDMALDRARAELDLAVQRLGRMK